MSDLLNKRGIRMSEDEKPRIDFPCEYPIKIMGDAVDSFHVEVVEIIRRHAPEVSEEHVSSRPSAKGNYVALTVFIQATGEDQLKRLFTDLKSLPAVKMVL